MVYYSKLLYLLVIQNHGYGIIIFGWVDGHSHAVMNMEAKTNNRASTALEVFLTAVSYYGCPSRVR
jgi:hypothetical protein